MPQPLLLRLYITGSSPNSAVALANLEAIRARSLPPDHEVEIVNVQKEPARSYADGVVIVPTLIKVAPEPRVTILGNLSEQEKVLAALGLTYPPGDAEQEKGTAES